jgi:CheY-like chemotaxis protein
VRESTRPQDRRGHRQRARVLTVPTAEPLPNLKGISTLLIEDNGDFRDAMESILQTCGARTIPVSSVSEARATCEAEPPHIIVSDLVLPDGTGADFMDWLRERPSERGGAVAVVAVTAFPHYFPEVRAKGFAAYLVKPIDLADLCWTIASVLGRGSRA